jgi:hypothetical protein
MVPVLRLFGYRGKVPVLRLFGYRLGVSSVNGCATVTEQP